MLLKKSRVKEATREVDPTYLRNVVESMSYPRPMGSETCVATMKSIFTELHSFGYNVKVVGETQNVVAGNLSKAKILIGSHYDSVPNTPGADDNASAVASMLGIAKALAPTEDVCFVSFNGEEVGLQGSREFVKLLPKKNNLEQVHILEMVGYRSTEPNSQKNPLGKFAMNVPTVGDFIGIVTNSYKILKSAMSAESNVQVVGMSIPFMISLDKVEKIAPHIFRSDHAPFWKAGYKAAMWTDTAEFRNSNYHSLTDTPDTLDYEFMSDVCQAVLSTIRG